MDDSKNFEINPTNEFHVLRHFTSVDESYKKTLLDQPYWYYDYLQEKFIYSRISREEIEYALATIGTKFLSDIPEIDNPKKLLTLVQEKFTALSSRNSVQWISENETARFIFSFEYDHVVGQANVLSINNLTREYRRNVTSILRSKCAGENEIIVHTVSGIEMPFTKMIYVEIVSTPQLPFCVITAFPDCSVLDNSIKDLTFDNMVFII